jgi:hypothetical protein
VLLDGLEHARLARLGESDRGAFATGTTCPPDSMDIRIGRGGNVEVEDVGQVANIEPACSDVGCDEEVEAAFAEAAHHAVALLLRESAVNRLCTVASRIQSFGELVDFRARAAEHDRRCGILDVEDSAECRGFLLSLDDVGDLSNSRELSRPCFLRGDADAHRILQVALRDRSYAWREGRREECGLA